MLSIIADKIADTFNRNQGLSIREAGQTAGFVQALQIRVVLTAYDVTPKQEYLEAAKAWADFTLHLQGTHGHPDAYNMGYNLKVDKGIPAHWYVADTSTIATALSHLAYLLDQDDPLHTRIIDSLKRYFYYIEEEWRLPNGAYALGYFDSQKLNKEPYHCAVAEGLLFMWSAYQLTGEKQFRNRGIELLSYQLQNPSYDTLYYGGPVHNRTYQGTALLASLPKLSKDESKLKKEILHHFQEFVLPWAIKNQKSNGAWEYVKEPGIVDAKTNGLVMVLQLILPWIDLGEKHRETINKGYIYIEKNTKLSDTEGRPLGHWEGLALAGRDYPEKLFPQMATKK